nr:MAG TPA: hypothetical protein [Bacteriophage sp.]DAK44618.1 MAG TPA: hypothetical protein [Herelleviridae sp.]DAM52926.1 MAG TPA: hypothetical protein [Caudoviricetes sp.]DAM87519.1 MAG TPA: hypothetical protein [Bacteriophage sp.]DAN33198.1 MAG TPA: hypothetical protein [Caudoviricetes sp.]
MNKIARYDNIEDYLYSTCVKFYEDYKKRLKESDGVDLSYPQFKINM